MLYASAMLVASSLYVLATSGAEISQAGGSAAVQSAVPAQTPPSSTPTSETPKQRLERLGVMEDPGPDPSPSTQFIRFGKPYTIGKFEKRHAKFDQREGWVRPFKNVNYPAEIYRQDDKFIWVWLEAAQEAELLPNPEEGRDNTYAQHEPEQIKYLEGLKGEFNETLLPPASAVKLSFEESSEGLPQEGSWRNSLDVADMNEDGFLDLVAPPQRGGGRTPSIFLGDGKGHWKKWAGLKFPRSLDYGSVVAGDLNKDGHQDLAFGIHLVGITVFLGNGKGNFVESNQGLPNDFPTRRIRLVDLERDGDLDIVALSEGPQMYKQESSVTKSLLRAYINEGKAKSWKAMNLSQPGYLLGGDWLVAANFNGDSLPDFAASSTYFNSPDLFYVSDGKMRWKPDGRGWLPFVSMYTALTAGRFTRAKTDEVILGFSRAWPNPDPRQISAPKHLLVGGVERVIWTGTKSERRPVARWAGENGPLAMASGDFDGDGNLDIAYSVSRPRQHVILLGDGKGNFARPVVTGFEPPKNINYDIKVADLNNDKAADLIVMYEAEERVKDGSIKVYLNRSVRSGTRTAQGKR